MPNWNVCTTLEDHVLAYMRMRARAVVDGVFAYQPISPCGRHGKTEAPIYVVEGCTVQQSTVTVRVVVYYTYTATSRILLQVMAHWQQGTG